MKRHLQLSEPLRMHQLTKDEWTCEWKVQADELSPLCLELSMLGLGLSEQLTLTSGGGVTAAFTYAETLAWPRVEAAGQRLQFALNRRALELLQSFLLTYYRDGMAAVNHLDLEVEYQGPLGRQATLIVKAADFAAPLSPEEAAAQIFGVKKS